MSQNYCIECGASLVQDSNFCGKCGSDLRKQNEKELEISLKANTGPVADLTPEFSAISEVSQFDQKSSSIGKTLAAWIIGFVAFVAIIIAVAAPNPDNEFEPSSTSSSESESYKIGYELGISGSIGQLIFQGGAESAEEACNFILEMSRGGTTNDGIDWASLNSTEYLDGCLAGQRIAHPSAVWNE